MNDAVTAWLQKSLHLKSLARAQHHPHYNHLAGFVTAQLASGRLNYPTFCCQTSPPGRQSSSRTPTPLRCRIRNPRTAHQAQRDTPAGAGRCTTWHKEQLRSLPPGGRTMGLLLLLLSTPLGLCLLGLVIYCTRSWGLPDAIPGLRFQPMALATAG